MDEHDLATEIAKEIGKQVPVKQIYDDAASPAVRQVGSTLEDVIKCVRLVGFPIQWFAVQQDRYRRFIEGAAAPIPDNQRILPPTQILGPVLEGIKFETEGSEISDLFEKLLSSAMDKERVHLAHPSFAAIIKSISPDEAKIIRFLGSDKIFTIDRHAGTYDQTLDGHFIILLDNLGLLFPQNSSFYLHHLFSLGLLDWDGEYGVHGIQLDGRDTLKRALKLSILGRRLIEACTRPA